MQRVARRLRPAERHTNVAAQVMRASKDIITFTAARRAFMLALTISGVQACGPRGQPVIIGVAASARDPEGAAVRLGAELAASDLNRRGGVRGRGLELAFEDDDGSVEGAEASAKRLAARRDLVAVFGHASSQAMFAAAQVYGAGRTPVPLITTAASSADAGSAGAYAFRFGASDSLHAASLAEWARKRLGARTAAILYPNDDRGRRVRTAFSRRFSELGGEIVALDPFTPALLSFEPYLRRLRARGSADVLLIGGAGTGTSRILRTLDSIAIVPRLLAPDDARGLERAGPRAEGAFVSTVYLADAPGERNRAFVGAVRQARRKSDPDARMAVAYDAVQLLARAVEAAGPDRRRVREYLAGVGSKAPFTGLTGLTAVTPTGDLRVAAVQIGVVRAGHVVTPTAP